MHDFLRLMAFGAGALCLGVGLAVAAIFALASRYSDDSGESLVGSTFLLTAIVVAAYFFSLAV